MSSIRLVNPTPHQRPLFHDEQIEGPFGAIVNLYPKDRYALVTKENPTLYIIDRSTDLCKVAHRPPILVEGVTTVECVGAVCAPDYCTFFLLLVVDSIRMMLWKICLSEDYFTCVSSEEVADIHIDPNKRLMFVGSTIWNDATTPCSVIEQMCLNQSNVRLGEYVGDPRASFSGLLFAPDKIPPKLIRMRGYLVVFVTTVVLVEWFMYHNVRNSQWVVPYEAADISEDRPADPVHPDQYHWIDDPYTPPPYYGTPSIHPEGSPIELDWKSFRWYREVWDKDGSQTGTPGQWFILTGTGHTDKALGTYALAFDMTTLQLCGLSMIGSSYVS